MADLYQGGEVWDLSLVDPDNRRPVDFERRRHLLAALAGTDPPAAVPVDGSGAAKLWLTHRVLTHRRHHPGAYASTGYDPLAVCGTGDDTALAFSRGEVAVVVPLRTPDAGSPDTVELPGGRWRDVVTGAEIDGGRRRLAELWDRFPVAVLARGAT